MADKKKTAKVKSKVKTKVKGKSESLTDELNRVAARSEDNRSEEHLEAALALWQYCEDSARYIFGNQTGNKTADAIYTALLGSEDGLTKTQIRDLFQRNKTANEINSALKLLIEIGKIDFIKEVTSGRPCEIFIARSYAKNDINDKSDDFSP